MTKMYINRLDMEKIAMVLAEIHGIHVDDAYLNPGKWLKTSDDDEVFVVPEFKPQLPPKQDPKQETPPK